MFKINQPVDVTRRLTKKYRGSGFTLIELLAVLAIIAILATAATIFYTGLRLTQRDGKRFSDLGQVTKALELYYQDNTQYPVSGCNDNNVSACAVLSQYLPDIAKVNDPSDSVAPCAGGAFEPCNYSFGTVSSGDYEIFFYVERPYDKTGNNCNILKPNGVEGCDLWGIGVEH